MRRHEPALRALAPIAAGHAASAALMTAVHGAGLMLAPVLVPLCSSDGSVREVAMAGSQTLALAASGMHAAAMLGMTAVVNALLKRCYSI
ncbi:MULTISPECIES: hypothetical protein [unclassified Duganella]|uniref:hypothetical protein n=1 Tax=unclassified Duganella TaxID=2636909 RepID=UPI000E3510A0|nr:MULTISPECIES: hypothetical protein [unclassified Duganella]RFP15950.1 hypothetical protein D0T23_08585 [Duganella sp. BJB475]RFP32886.1 hypothetical protein D0T21_12045 [Duganella sp. BJB476]